MRNRQWKVYLVLLSLFLCAVALFSSKPYLQSTHASGVAFQTGDVLAAVGNGKIKHFSPDGQLLDTLDTGAGSTENAGMAFDAAGNLYATVFQANNIYKFDNKGNPIGTFGSGYNLHPESIVFDKSGNVYVGQADGSGQVLKFDATGRLLDAYSPQRERRGTDWIDLAADQCTLRYTSEGSSIKSFNICTKTQLTDFATGLSAPCYGHRIRPNAEELVACTSRVYRLNSSGGVIQTYQLAGTSLLFALNLDPDNKTFWTADLLNGTVFRIDIATGTIVKQFNAGIFLSLGGLTIVGEITAAITVPPPTTSYYIKYSSFTSGGNTVNVSDTLHDLGVQLAQSQMAAGTPQESVVALLFGAQKIILNDWKASSTYVSGQLIVDSNAYAQQITTAGTSGSSQPVWNTTIGGTTKDGTAAWINRGRLGTWQQSHTYIFGQLIVDSKGFVQQVSAAGTSGSSQPVWNTTLGGTTEDGTAAWANRGQTGATLWYYPSPLSDIKDFVKDFVIGYYGSLGSNQNTHVRIIIATNNSGASLTYAPYVLGQAWAQMVNDVAAWVVDQRYSGRVDIAGGSDMETDYDSPAVTRAWVDGYASVSPQRFLYDVGDAAGCPTSRATATAGSCDSGWNQEDVWHVSWGADPAQPLPEIYNTSNAKQWANLSLYGYLNPGRRNGGSVIMAGALTELGACTQYPSDQTCKPPFTPAQGWKSLDDQLNNDLRTKQSLPWSTDVRVCDDKHANCQIP